MGEFGRYTTEEIDEWQKNPAIRSILTSPMMGAWLMRRDANIEHQLGEAIRIPQNAINGDVIKAMFPKYYQGILSYLDNTKWWNAPYKQEVEE